MTTKGGAKGKGKHSPKPKTPQTKTFKSVAFRVSEPYWEWLARLAEANRTTISGLMDQALAARAEAIGFEESPPKRV